MYFNSTQKASEEATCNMAIRPCTYYTCFHGTVVHGDKDVAYDTGYGYIFIYKRDAKKRSKA